MLLALLMGLFGGVGLAFLFEYLDNSVKSHEDVEKATGDVATLGVVPAFSQNGFGRGYGYGRGGIKVRIETKAGAEARKKRRPEVEVAAAKLAEAEKAAEAEVKSVEMIAHLSPKSNLAESYRTIRTSLLLSSADKKPKTIVVTSALPEEGKSVTLSNLAVTLAQAGKTVLVVDSDFRKPRQHRIFRIRNVDGLTNYLTSEVELKALVKATEVPNLWVINVGPVPPNPAELLGSEKMGSLIESLKQWFDFILFDSPPVLSVSDAVVLGPKIDGVILVVWGGKTAREALKQAKEKLDMLKVKCLGVVINNIDIQEHDYYYMHHYYHYYGEGK
jgi:capsular exopolysaccharide synthesis family protein